MANVTSGGAPVLPRWARLLDALGVGLILIGLSISATGGFREWTPLGRISITSWMRPVIIGAIVLFVRHWICRRPSIVQRIVTAVRSRRRSDESRIIWPVFLSTRLGVLVVGFLGVALIGYAPNTPPWRVYANEFLNLPARWDTGWYLGIALDGYQWEASRGSTQQNIAFFPLFPMLMRYSSLFFARQLTWVGVLISFVSFFFALRYVFRFTRAHVGEPSAAATVGLLATYPFALFYSTAYTEALFLLTSVAACYHFERDERWKAAVWGIAAGLTRPNGCLLSIVLSLLAFRKYWDTRDRRSFFLQVAVAAAPGVGMLLYSTFIYSLTGNALQWAEQNAAWGRVYRGVDALVDERIAFVQQYGLYDYASTRTLDLIYSLALIFMLVSVWPVYRRLGVPYAALILLNVLPPLVMGGLLSMGRVTAVVFPTFVWLGAAVPERHRWGWLVGFAMLQALCAIAFFTWRPVY